MSFTEYVVMVVFDPTFQYVVGITKKKGPSFLLEKLCFPGGKVELSEEAILAALREMHEETGLHIPLSAWRQADYFRTEDRGVATFAAVSDQFFTARTCELEPVWQLKVDKHQRYAIERPERYAPDFLDLLAKARAVLSEQL